MHADALPFFSAFPRLAPLSPFSSVDPYSRKEWYDVKAPSYFSVRNVGKVIVNRTQGTSTFFLRVAHS